MLRCTIVLVSADVNPSVDLFYVESPRCGDCTKGGQNRPRAQPLGKRRFIDAIRRQSVIGLTIGLRGRSQNRQKNGGFVGESLPTL